jgi:hypothetical protein
MYVRYGRQSQRPSYVCSTQRSDYGLPLCQSLAAESSEAWLAQPVLAALRPAALEACLTALYLRPSSAKDSENFAPLKHSSALLLR